MCGILAEYARDGLTAPADFSRILGRLAPRGPDGEGTWRCPEGRVALGHRRLAIMDLSERGHQPMGNETDDVRLVHNGEIYNFAALRRDLEAKEHLFSSGSDSEVIIHAYEEWGDECVARLRGIFAFALWDGRRRRLLLARDQLGVKPLYLWRRPGGLVAASEAKAILEHPAFERRLHLPALQSYLAWRYVPEGESAFAGLETLPPGHLLVVDENGTQKVQYWEAAYRPRITDAAEAVATVTATLQTSLQLQRMSDVPIGVLLSGGIDSSAILGGLSEVTGQRLPCYTTGFEDPRFDERPFARIAAAANGSPLDELVLTREVMMSAVADYIEWHDEPCFDYSAIPIFLMARRARKEGVKVLFAGDGGDELFGGYTHYDRIWSWTRSWKGRFARWRGRQAPELAKQYFAGMGYLDAGAQRTLVPDGPEFDVLALVRKHMPAQSPGVVAAQLCDLNTFLVSDILTKVDRASMAAGVEVRVPWLDHHLVELAFQIDHAITFRRGERKHVLRRAVAGWLPPELNTARKKGFGFPMDTWLDPRWRQRASTLVGDGSLVARGVFAPRVALDLVQNGPAAVCWLLFCAELWARHWLEGRDTRDALETAGLVLKEGALV